MNNIKLQRFNRGSTVGAVVEGTGLSYATIAKAEDTGECSARVAKKLADFYEITVAELLGVDSREAA